MFKTIIISLAVKTLICHQVIISTIKSQNASLGVVIEDDLPKELLASLLFPNLPIFFFSLIILVMVSALRDGFKET